MTQSNDGSPPTLAPRGAAERFAPGTLVAKRYRIVAMLGRGGMGEVYRADDIRLNQKVALKFLPPRLETNPEALERFLAEVRLGRQVSHPNVCRLYDIGEHERLQFITMEYVDGENLASLLRRIGKLPPERAVQIARDIAAGLAAAHAIGIMHRDLKPSNVMIDGKGRGRISDFGLAVEGDEGDQFGLSPYRADSDSPILGTPAYMAPEQLAGKIATPQSDVYGFGLILFECLTGHPFHGVGPADEVLRRRRSDSGGRSTETVQDVDPTVERLLRRCLDVDPLQRPASGQFLFAALPGVDPLAVAMAAGETPSPDLVAAAGARGELSHAAAWSLLLAMVIAAIAFAALYKLTFLHASIEGIRSPDTLAERGAVIAAALSGARARDRSAWFHWDYAYVSWLRRSVKGIADWRSIANQRPTPVRFTYRQSPAAMAGGVGRGSDDDPPLNVPGMSRVTLDQRGRLMELVVVPPERTSGRAPIDWQPLFAFAELPMPAFRPAAPEWSPPVHSDDRRAWTGTPPGVNMPLRVEAAAHAGRPVWFAVILPSRTARLAGGGTSTGLTAMTVLQVVVPLFTLVLAFRNLRRGRGDRRGAVRLALVAFAAALFARLVRAHHPPDAFEEIDLVQRVIGQSLFVGVTTGLAYLGLEPYVRRHEPEALISWVRLANGRFRDPLVGRHTLIGMTLGTAAMLLWCFLQLAQPFFGLRSAMPIVSMLSALNGVGDTLFWMLRRFELSVMDGINAAFLLVAFRAAVRKRWAAYALLYVTFVLILMPVPGDLLIMRLMFALIVSAVALAVLHIAGVLGITAFALAANEITVMPLTLDPFAFHSGRSLFALLVLIGLAAMAMIVSLGRKPVLGAA